jgi:NADH:ubiquinone oxidoreductase subunit 2 (subunit N)
LESQNFCFLVLCGLLPDLPVTSGFSIEASINYLLLSAFSSGVLLFWTSQIYLQTGMTSLTFLLPACLLLILLAFMFKLGAAPMHMWVADIYQSISKPLLMYLATAPKLSLFGFWVSAFQHVWNSRVAFLAALSLAVGSFGAYAQPAMRKLFAFSTVNEIGLLLLAVETAGFHYLRVLRQMWYRAQQRRTVKDTVDMCNKPRFQTFMLSIASKLLFSPLMLVKPLIL